MAETLHRIAEARLCPPRDASGEGGGVFTADGAFFPPGNVERDGGFEMKERPLTAQPVERLAGLHLYGGQINHHFGHFLCESLARLWPLTDPALAVDDILMLPRRPGAVGESHRFQDEVFALLGPLPPIRVIDRPMQVESLLVPDQGFGTGRLCRGSLAFRDFLQQRFARDIAAEGPERLYIARTKLSPTRGAVSGEELLAAELEREGYAVFYPEKASIAEQVARYRAARQVVAVEGSALHLFGFVAQPGQRVAQIVRRSDGFAAGGIALQLESFAGIRVAMIQAIRREWNVAGRKRLASRSVSELDVPEIGRRLAEAGFVASRPWPEVRPAMTENLLTRVEKRTGLRYAPFPPR